MSESAESWDYEGAGLVVRGTAWLVYQSQIEVMLRQ